MQSMAYQWRTTGKQKHSKAGTGLGITNQDKI